MNIEKLSIIQELENFMQGLRPIEKSRLYLHAESAFSQGVSEAESVINEDKDSYEESRWGTDFFGPLPIAVSAKKFECYRENPTREDKIMESFYNHGVSLPDSEAFQHKREIAALWHNTKQPEKNISRDEIREYLYKKALEESKKKIN